MSQNPTNPPTPPYVLGDGERNQPHVVRPSQRSSPTDDAATPTSDKSVSGQATTGRLGVGRTNTIHSGPDQSLVNQTRQQIRSLAAEVEQLAKSDCTEEEFFEGFLTRSTSALASIGGAIWMMDDQQHLGLRYQINLKQTGLAERPAAQTQHHRLLHRVLAKGESTLIAPQSGAAPQSNANESSDNADSDAANPTDFLLVLAPLTVDQKTVGLIEIFQRAATGPNTQQGYLRFLNQMGETGSRYLANHQIRSFAAQQEMWHQLEQFIRSIHQGLNSKQTIYTLANESRRLIDCDRVSVAIGTGRNCRVKSVSGLDSIERRADQVKQLNLLAAAVIKAGQPLWYNDQHSALPPQLESKLQRYVDQSHTKMLAVIPLMETSDDPAIDQPNKKKKKPKPIGALIVEQLSDSRISPTTRQRVDVVVHHGQTALANANRYSSIFLMPLWQFLGKVCSIFNVEQRWKTAVATLAIIGAGLFLTLFPYTFGLNANGRLVPESQFEVFAQTDGTMEEIFVSDTGDTIVQNQQLLGRMKNSDIELAISNIRGQIAEAESRIGANMQRKSSGKLEINEKTELDSKIKSDEQTIRSLQRDLEIRQQEQQLLSIVSPSAGRVVNWNVKQNLTNRPVTRGQNLMTVVPPDAVWELELQMPERRLAHLFRAVEESDEKLKVTFGLVSNPGTEYTGTLISVDRKLDVYNDDGNAALVRVAFENSDMDAELLLTETRVTAKVHCGDRSIGYVIFHELIETVQSKWMLWF